MTVRGYLIFMTTKNTELNAETITDRQIEELREEALAAHTPDLVQSSLCAVALATDLGEVAEIEESVRADLEQLGVIPEHVGADVVARGLCARAINSARAREDA